jgi:hypothetical protein
MQYAETTNGLRSVTTDKALEQRILEYLAAHPLACDTLEGVAKWWVMSQQIAETILAVRGALDRLKQRGLVEEQRCADGQTLYRITRSE